MILGISGKIETGKDTLAKMIIDSRAAMNENWKIKKFGGKLKQIVAILIGCTVDDLESHDFKNKKLGKDWDRMTSVVDPHSFLFSKVLSGYTVRDVLQIVGTEAMRDNLHKDVWVNALASDFRPGDNWIITDVRFENEAMAIKRWGGMLVRIDRPSLMPNDHISETALDDFKSFDLIVNNDGDEVRLYEFAELISFELGNKYL